MKLRVSLSSPQSGKWLSQKKAPRVIVGLTFLLLAWNLQMSGLQILPMDLDLDATIFSSPTLTNGDLYPAFDTQLVTLQPNVRDFERQSRVVICTKIHGPHMLFMAAQFFCLLHHSYNERLLYDLILFTTEPLSEQEMAPIHEMVAPANLTVVLDNRGSLQAEIAALSPIRRQRFFERCHKSNPQLVPTIDALENVTWWTECPGRVAYNWQAEFRSWHIWRHPALAPYKYMMWIDTDGFCSKPWEQDPVAHMIRNDLVVLFDHFPQGAAKGAEIQRRIHASLNVTLCNVSVNKNGTLQSTTAPDLSCENRSINDIHGFFHITNLDFYRSPKVIHFAETFIGDCFLCREFDDQAAVTIPAAVLASERSQDMRANGMNLGVFHNGHLDGQFRETVGGFLRYWRNTAANNFPVSARSCPIRAGN